MTARELRQFSRTARRHVMVQQFNVAILNARGAVVARFRVPWERVEEIQLEYVGSPEFSVVIEEYP